MPYITTWVPPELFMTHKGVNVFHTYKDDEIEQGPRKYWFTLCSINDDDEYHFDVCELDDGKLLDLHPPYLQGDNDTFSNRLGWETWHNEGEPAAIRTIIREALDAGRIPLPDPGDNLAEPIGD